MLKHLLSWKQILSHLHNFPPFLSLNLSFLDWCPYHSDAPLLAKVSNKLLFALFTGHSLSYLIRPPRSNGDIRHNWNSFLHDISSFSGLRYLDLLLFLLPPWPLLHGLLCQIVFSAWPLTCWCVHSSGLFYLFPRQSPLVICNFIWPQCQPLPSNSRLFAQHQNISKFSQLYLQEYPQCATLLPPLLLPHQSEPLCLPTHIIVVTTQPITRVTSLSLYSS